MSYQFLEPKPFYGNKTEDAREWIEKTESWLSYNNYANWPKLEEMTDEVEKKSIQESMTIAKRRVPYILEIASTGICGMLAEQADDGRKRDI